MTPDGIVLRTRLFDLVAGPPRIRAVVAPTGFGKTALVRSWIDAGGAPGRVSIWLTLTADVHDRHEFWQLAAAAVARTVGPDTNVGGVDATTADPAAESAPAIAPFLDEPAPLLLVVDGFEHTLRTAGVIDRDILGLTTGGDQLHVVVITRAATSLVDDTNLMRGLVRVIDESDLRFTADEVERLLEFHAPHAVGAGEHIASDTGGYPLAVRAAAYALGRRGKIPTRDAGWHNLVTSSFESQLDDPALVDFVLDTCTPPFFDRQLASALHEPDNVDSALAALAAIGFGRWTPHVDGQPVFQYIEPVRVAFAVRARAARGRRFKRNLVLSAAWMHRHGHHDIALELAIDGHDYDLATAACHALALTNPDLYKTGAFIEHTSKVPRTELARQPVLALVRAMALTTNSATRASAKEYFEVAATHALDGLDRLEPAERFRRHVGRDIALRYLGRNRQAAEANRAALEHLDSMTDADRDELGEYLAMALSILAYSVLQNGAPDRAIILVERAIAAARFAWWRNFALAFATAIHAFVGRVSDAKAAIAATADGTWPPEHERPIPHSLGLTGMAVLCLDDFDFAGALDAYDSAPTLVEAAESWPLITWVLMHARLGLGDAGSEARRVETALATAPRRPGLSQNLATAAMLNALAILWLADDNIAKGRLLLRSRTPFPGQFAPARLLFQLADGHPAAALRDVAGLLAKPGHTLRSVAAVETLGAAAAIRAGNDGVAAEMLTRAAATFQLFGTRAHLLYVPAGDLEALRSLASTMRSPMCAEYLAVRVPCPIAMTTATPVELTRREVEVLAAWASHDTRAALARALYVSENTVKSQLKSAYRKLSVTTKDAAIQRAIELDLLPRAGD